MLWEKLFVSWLIDIDTLDTSLRQFFAYKTGIYKWEKVITDMPFGAFLVSRWHITMDELFFFMFDNWFEISDNDFALLWLTNKKDFFTLYNKYLISKRKWENKDFKYFFPNSDMSDISKNTSLSMLKARLEKKYGVCFTGDKLTKSERDYFNQIHTYQKSSLIDDCKQKPINPDDPWYGYADDIAKISRKFDYED